MLASAGWVAARFVTLSGTGEAFEHRRAAGHYWLDRIAGRAAMHHAEAVQGAGPIAHFGAFA
jgi:hypothetical protein